MPHLNLPIFFSDMSKIAIPVRDNFLCGDFSHCSCFLVYEINHQNIIGKKIDFFPKRFKNEIADWAEKYGITDMIVRGIDKESLEVFSTTRINLFVGVKISNPDLLVEDFLNGTLRSDTHRLTGKSIESKTYNTNIVQNE